MRRLGVVAGLVLAAGLSACASDRVTNPVLNVSLAGTWTLEAINGFALPYVIAQVGSDGFEIVSDVITADSAGAFTESTVVQAIVNGQVTADTIPDAGAYEVSGSSVALTFASDSASAVGTIAGNALSLTEGSGAQMVYLRQ